MTNTINLLMIAGDYTPTICGVGDYCDNLCTELSKQNINISLLTQRIPNAPIHQISNGIDVHREVDGWYMSDISRVTRMINQLGNNTIVHIQYSCASNYHRRIMINLLPLFVHARKPNIPVVVTMHGFHEQSYLWRTRAMPMILAANMLILVNPLDFNLIGKWFRPGFLATRYIPIASNIRLVKISNYEREDLRLQYGFESDDCVISFFGGIRPDKGIHHLLRVAHELRTERLPCRLLVMSNFHTEYRGISNYNLEISRALKSAVQQGWATTVNAPSSSMVSKLLQISDIAVFPFTNGGTSNRGSLLAAVNHGIPTITTHGPSTPDDFEYTYGVKTVPAEDYSALYSCVKINVISVSAREKLRERVVQASRTLSWNEIAQQHMNVYHNMIQSKSVNYS